MVQRKYAEQYYNRYVEEKKSEIQENTLFSFRLILLGYIFLLKSNVPNQHYIYYIIQGRNSVHIKIDILMKIYFKNVGHQVFA